MLNAVSFIRTWGSKDRYPSGHNIKVTFVYMYPGGIRNKESYVTPASAANIAKRLTTLGYGHEVLFTSSGKGDIIVTYSPLFVPKVVIGYSGDHQDVYTLECPDGIEVSYQYQD